MHDDEAKTSSELSDPDQIIYSEEPKVDEDLATPTTDVQSNFDIQNTLEAHEAPAPQDMSPVVSTLQNPSLDLVAEDVSKKGMLAYLIAPVIGVLLLGAGLWKTRFAPAVNTSASTSASTSEWASFMAPIALLIGGLILLGGLYYMLKSRLGNRTVN